MKILILGGTTEARQLANRLVDAGHEVITSLAGRTQDPILPEGSLRMGRFGGVPGLCAYLRAAHIDYLVDATHPYAGLISINAVAAANATGVPMLRVMRPAWAPVEGQTWTVVSSAGEAARALPAGATALLTTGHTGLSDFLERDDCHLIVRLIEAPALDIPAHAQLELTRPPYDLAHERTLMKDHGVTHMVSKNSGGQQTSAKLLAAQELGVKVIMIERPIYGPATEAPTVDEAMAVLTAASTGAS